MKLIINNILLYNILLLLCILITTMDKSLAFTNSNLQSIHIQSDQEIASIFTNTITFIGHVSIKYMDINIHAHKVIVTQMTNNTAFIEGYGDPITFEQIQKHGKLIHGSTLKIYYDIHNNIITMIGNACLVQSNNNIQGDRIVYLIRKQYIEVFSNQGNQVTTLILPNKIN